MSPTQIAILTITVPAAIQVVFFAGMYFGVIRRLEKEVEKLQASTATLSSGVARLEGKFQMMGGD